MVVIAQGQARLQGSIAELTRANARSVRVETASDSQHLCTALDTAGITWQPAPPRPEAPDRTGLLVSLPLGVEDADGILHAAATAGVVIRSIEAQRSTLEEVFLRAIDGDDTPRAQDSTSPPLDGPGQRQLP